VLFARTASKMGLSARRDVPAHVFVVVPETAPSLGSVEHFAAPSSPPATPTAAGSIPLHSAYSPGLHRRPSAQFPMLMSSTSADSTPPSSPSFAAGGGPVTNVAFVMGTFFSWSGESPLLLLPAYVVAYLSSYLY
jgi:hypothetical protein